MKHDILIAFLSIGLTIHAQKSFVSTCISEADSMFTPKLTGEIYIREPRHQGEVFFNNKWVESTILLSTGEKINGEKIKYNGHLDNVIWLNKTNHTQFVLDKSYISAFWTKDSLNKQVHFQRINVNDSTESLQKDIFVEVAVEGKISLFIYHKISSIPDVIVNDNQVSYAIDAFAYTPVYYLKLPDSRYLKLKRISLKNFLNLLPDHQGFLSGLIRKNQLKLKSESGLIEAIRLINKSNF